MKDCLQTKTWLRLFYVILLAVVMAVYLFLINYGGEIMIARAGSDDATRGYAWSEHYGWISFNCTDTSCASFDYGVDVNTDMNFSGYAWSDNIGWISFQETGAPDYVFKTNCPNLCDSTNSCTACFDNVSGLVYGWAKALSLGDDGWIRLDDDDTGDGIDYGVSIVGGEFHGWAWDSDPGIGWLSFNCADPGTGGCSGHDYKVVLNMVLPPLEPTNLTASPQNCNSINLDWDHDGTNVDGYETQWAIATSGPWNAHTPNIFNPSQTSRVVSQPAETTYYYRVRALGTPNSDWEPADDGVGATTPACPISDLAYVSYDCDGVTLSWTKPGGVVDSYDVWRNKDNGGWVEYDPGIASTTTSYIDTSIDSGASYSYRLVIQNGGDVSNETEVIRPCQTIPIWREIKSR